jgi:hypothetical protein
MIPRELNRRIDLRDPRPERVAFARRNLSRIESRALAIVEREPAAMDPVLDAAEASPGPVVRWATALGVALLFAAFFVLGVLLMPLSVTVLAVLCFMDRRRPVKTYGVTLEAYAAGHAEADFD